MVDQQQLLNLIGDGFLVELHLFKCGNLTDDSAPWEVVGLVLTSVQ